MSVPEVKAVANGNAYDHDEEAVVRVIENMYWRRIKVWLFDQLFGKIEEPKLKMSSKKLENIDLSDDSEQLRHQ